MNNFCPVESINCKYCDNDSCDATGVNVPLRYLDGTVHYLACIVPGRQQSVEVKETNDEKMLRRYSEGWDDGRSDMQRECVEFIPKFYEAWWKNHDQNDEPTDGDLIAAIKSLPVK